MRVSTIFLKAADAKEMASSITEIANEKLKLEKEVAAGKNKTGNKFFFFLLFYFILFLSC